MSVFLSENNSAEIVSTKQSINFDLMYFRKKLAKLLNKQDIFIGYVGGSAILPEPLNKEEEKAALDRLKSGDETIRQTLIERNLRLVVYIARKIRQYKK